MHAMFDTFMVYVKVKITFFFQVKTIQSTENNREANAEYFIQPFKNVY